MFILLFTVLSSRLLRSRLRSASCLLATQLFDNAEKELLLGGDLLLKPNAPLTGLSLSSENGGAIAEATDEESVCTALQDLTLQHTANEEDFKLHSQVANNLNSLASPALLALSDDETTDSSDTPKQALLQDANSAADAESHMRHVLFLDSLKFSERTVRNLLPPFLIAQLNLLSPNEGASSRSRPNVGQPTASPAVCSDADAEYVCLLLEHLLCYSRLVFERLTEDVLPKLSLGSKSSHLCRGLKANLHAHLDLADKLLNLLQSPGKDDDMIRVRLQELQISLLLLRVRVLFAFGDFGNCVALLDSVFVDIDFECARRQAPIAFATRYSELLYWHTLCYLTSLPPDSFQLPFVPIEVHNPTLCDPGPVPPPPRANRPGTKGRRSISASAATRPNAPVSSSSSSDDQQPQHLIQRVVADSLAFCTPAKPSRKNHTHHHQSKPAATGTAAADGAQDALPPSQPFSITGSPHQRSESSPPLANSAITSAPQKSKRKATKSSSSNATADVRSTTEMDATDHSSSSRVILFSDTPEKAAIYENVRVSHNVRARALREPKRAPTLASMDSTATLSGSSAVAAEASSSKRGAGRPSGRSRKRLVGVPEDPFEFVPHSPFEMPRGPVGRLFESDSEPEGENDECAGTLGGRHLEHEHSSLRSNSTRSDALKGDAASEYSTIESPRGTVSQSRILAAAHNQSSSCERIALSRTKSALVPNKPTGVSSNKSSSVSVGRTRSNCDADIESTAESYTRTATETNVTTQWSLCSHIQLLRRTVSSLARYPPQTAFRTVSQLLALLLQRVCELWHSRSLLTSSQRGPLLDLKLDELTADDICRLEEEVFVLLSNSVGLLYLHTRLFHQRRKLRRAIKDAVICGTENLSQLLPRIQQLFQSIVLTAPIYSESYSYSVASSVGRQSITALECTAFKKLVERLPTSLSTLQLSLVRAPAVFLRQLFRHAGSGPPSTGRHSHSHPDSEIEYCVLLSRVLCPARDASPLPVTVRVEQFCLPILMAELDSIIERNRLSLVLATAALSSGDANVNVATGATSSSRHTSRTHRSRHAGDGSAASGDFSNTASKNKSSNRRWWETRNTLDQQLYVRSRLLLSL